MLRSGVNNEWTARLLREFVATQVLRRLFGGLEIDPAEAPLRGALIASQMAGLAMMWYIIRLEPLASAPPATIVAAVGPTVQRYLYADLSDQG